MTTTNSAEIPIFSPRLDEVLGMMIRGEAPNAGRFCSRCYTPMAKAATACPHCHERVDASPPLERLPSEIIALYRRMRRRESIVVNSFAFAGLFLAVLLFIVLVAIAVYAMDGSIPMFIVATVVLLVGGRVFAGILGGWIGDGIGYEYARRKLIDEWHEYERGRCTTPAEHPAATQ